MRSFFFSINVYSYKFPLVYLLLYAMNFGMLYLDFQLSQYICFPCNFFDSLFNSKCVKLYIFVILHFFILLLISSFILLWFEKILSMISIFKKILTPVLWPKIWSVLESVLCTCMNNVYSAVDGGVFCLCLLIVLFSSSISLLTFPLALLSVIESGVGFEVSC